MSDMDELDNLYILAWDEQYSLCAFGPFTSKEHADIWLAGYNASHEDQEDQAFAIVENPYWIHSDSIRIVNPYEKCNT